MLKSVEEEQKTRPHHGSSTSKTTAEAAAEQRPGATVDSISGSVDIYDVPMGFQLRAGR
jgi:hypothetical protein